MATPRVLRGKGQDLAREGDAGPITPQVLFGWKINDKIEENEEEWGDVTWKRTVLIFAKLRLNWQVAKEAKNWTHQRGIFQTLTRKSIAAMQKGVAVTARVNWHTRPERGVKDSVLGGTL